MNSKYALAISLLACSATCQAKRVDSTHKRLYPIALTLSVDALGKVSKLACKPTVPESLCPAMVRTVSAWKFAPGLVAGQPTAMDAVLTLNLLATRKGEGFELHAADASILQAAPAVLASALAEPRQQTPPRYPPDEMRKGSHGTVVIELLIVPGSDTPRVGSTWFDHEPADAKNPFVAASIKAVHSWKLDPGTAHEASFCVPIDFSISADAPPPDSSPCHGTYEPGFGPPSLLTPVLGAVF